jgi:hypothetical protein
MVPPLILVAETVADEPPVTLIAPAASAESVATAAVVFAAVTVARLR